VTLKKLFEAHDGQTRRGISDDGKDKTAVDVMTGDALEPDEIPMSV
jgi:hypothetical protein